MTDSRHEQTNVDTAERQEPATVSVWVKPEIEIVDIRETLSVGLGNNDGTASHT